MELIVDSAFQHYLRFALIRNLLPTTATNYQLSTTNYQLFLRGGVISVAAVRIPPVATACLKGGGAAKGSLNRKRRCDIICGVSRNFRKTGNLRKGFASASQSEKGCSRMRSPLGIPVASEENRAGTLYQKDKKGKKMKTDRIAKRMAWLACCALAATVCAMPTKQQISQAQPLVNDLTADDLRALKAKEKTPGDVAASHLALADKADTEAGKYLLLQGAFRLYARGGDYDAAAVPLQRMRGEIAELPPEVIVEIVNKEIGRAHV